MSLIADVVDVDGDEANHTHVSIYPRRLAHLTPALLLGCLCWLSPASANMSAPGQHGESFAEPAPELSAAHIVHEQLTIDMRPVEHDGPARVTARYQVQNDGLGRRLSLLFVAPRLSQGRVVHDGAEVAARKNAEGLSFSLNLPAGLSTIEVAYEARTDRVRLDRVESFAIDYVLSPARRWASFGGLTLRVHVPERWTLLDLPKALAQQGTDADYRAQLAALPEHPKHRRDAHDWHWDLRELPADTLRIHVAPPRTPYLVLAWLQTLCNLSAVALPMLAWRRLSRRAKQTGSSVRARERLSSFGLCAALIAGVPFLPMLAEIWLRHRAADYEQLFMILAAWTLGGALCLFGHALAGFQPRT